MILPTAKIAQAPLLILLADAECHLSHAREQTTEAIATHAKKGLDLELAKAGVR
jgi:hypothetical protein